MNLYSGWSFNDMSQYPVFPWIHKCSIDPPSEIIKCTDLNVFWDLSKNMGQLGSSDWLEEYIRKFDEGDPF